MHVRLYDGADALDGVGNGVGTVGGVIDAPPVVPVGPGGMGAETGGVIDAPPVVPVGPGGIGAA